MASIRAERREIIGKKVAGLRRLGKIPAVLYGTEKNTVSIEIPEKDFAKVFREAGETSVVELELGGNKRNVLIHDIAFDPIKDTPIHVDFLEIRMDKVLRAKIPLVFQGESAAVKGQGGILVKVMHELEVEALPKDLPHEIKVDISKLENLEAKFTVADLEVPVGVKIIAKPEEVLALVETPRAEEEVAPEAAPSLESIEVVGKKKAEKEGEAEAEVDKTTEK